MSEIVESDEKETSSEIGDPVQDHFGPISKRVSSNILKTNINNDIITTKKIAE